MATVYIVYVNEYDYDSETPTYVNEKAFLTREKAEGYIADQNIRVALYKKKLKLTYAWRDKEKSFKPPVKDNSIKKQIESLYQAKEKVPCLDIDLTISVLKKKQEDLDTEHKQKMLEYERQRLDLKERFSDSLSKSDKEIFMDDNIREIREKDYGIEELELEE